MAEIVGTVAVKVKPDTSNFRKELRAELASVNEDVQVDVSLDVNTGSASAELSAWRKKQELNDVKIGVRLDKAGNFSAITGSLTGQLQQLNKAAEVIGTTSRSSFGGMSSGMLRLNKDAERATGSFKRFSGSLEKDVGHGFHAAKVAGVDVMHAFEGVASGVINFGSAFADAGGAMLGMGQSAAGAVEPIGKAGGGMASLGSAAVGFATQVAIWLPIIATLAGAVVAAFGSVAAGVAGLPTIILGLGLPIAAVMLGLDGIKKAAKTIKPEFDALKASVSATFEKGMKPIFQDLANNVFPTLRVGMNAIANSLVGVGKGLLDVVQSKVGLGQLNSTLYNTAWFVGKLQGPLSGLLNTFLRIGSTHSLWSILEQTIGNLVNQFSNFVNRILANGQLERGLANVRDLLASAGNAMFNLAQGSLAFFNGAAPGFTKFFKGLGDFFLKINWESLGAAFGNVFGSIGNWLANLNQGEVDAFVNSFIALAKNISDFVQSGGLDVLILGITGAANAMAAMVGQINILMGPFNDLKNLATGEDVDWGHFAKALIKAAINLLPGLGPILTSLLEKLGVFGDESGSKGKAAGDKTANGYNNAIKKMPNGTYQVTGDTKSAWASGFGSINSSIGRGVSDVLSKLGRMAIDGSRKAADFVSNLASTIGNISIVAPDLSGVGQAIMDSLRRGLEWAWNGVKSFLSWVTSQIPAWKGPYSKDKVLLRPAGIAIMQSLHDGLAAVWPQVVGFLQQITKDIQNALNVQASVGVDTTTSVGELGVAAKELLNAFKAGKSISEDLTFKGMSASGARLNDQLASLFYSSHKGLEQFLNDVIKAQTKVTKVAVDPPKITGLASNNALSAQLTAAVSADGFGGSNIEDKVASALSGWTVQMDSTGMARLVNKGNQKLSRRR